MLKSLGKIKHIHVLCNRVGLCRLIKVRYILAISSNVRESNNRSFYCVNASEIAYSLQKYQTVTSIYLFLFSVIGCDHISLNYLK
jgi:hypothetical protein